MRDYKSLSEIETRTQLIRDLWWMLVAIIREQWWIFVYLELLLGCRSSLHQSGLWSIWIGQSLTIAACVKDNSHGGNLEDLQPH
jgi:hypothetical protein